MYAETITFFNVNSDMLAQKSDEYVSEIRKALGNREIKEISKKIQADIYDLLSKADMFNESMTDVKIECIGSGSTSSCYRTCSNQNLKKIIKVFEPYDDIFAQGSKTFVDVIKAIKTGYWWIADGANIEDTERFLMRFTRFLEQKNEISDYIQSTNEKEKNAFVAPELMLSSRGFVYVVSNFYGKTLQEEFDSINPNRKPIKEEDKKQNLLNVIKLVRETAEVVYEFCHTNDKGVFHGDIKPENFLKIDTGIGEDANEYCIRAIDFDTWARNEKIKDGYLEIFSASTPLFYSIKSVPRTFGSLIKYDVSALANMLMYGLALAVGDDPCKKYDQVQGRFHWWIYFFTSQYLAGDEKECPAEKVFNIVNREGKSYQMRKDWGGVYIFELLRDLLRRVINCSSDRAIKKLNNTQNSSETFIGYLTSIENLLAADLSGNRPDYIDNRAIRYSGLLQINCAEDDERLQYNFYSENLLKSFVSQALEGYFSKKDMK